MIADGSFDIGTLRAFGPLWWAGLPFALVAIVLGAANLLWGTSAQRVAERVQRPLERRLCRRYLQQAVQDGDLDESLLAEELQPESLRRTG